MYLRVCGILLLGCLCISADGVSQAARVSTVTPAKPVIEPIVTSVLPDEAARAVQLVSAAIPTAVQPDPPAPSPALQLPPDPPSPAPSLMSMNSAPMTALLKALTQPEPPPRPAATRRDVQALVADMRANLGGVLLPDAPALTHAAMTAAQAMMRRSNLSIDTLQVVLVVDRSPMVQRLWVTVAAPGGGPLEVLGAVHVSTGKPGRKEHFRTPVGVFVDDAGILGYRAMGTYNEFHIRGIGIKGMRVWDFGWQTTDDWRKPRDIMAVRMEMHATDPTVLEPRLGRWDSEGCIRIPSRFNSYLDHTGLIDAKEREAARDDRRFAALLPKDAAPSPLAGQTLVVVDTSDPTAAPSDPARANLIAHPDTPGPEHDDAG
jgi:hypothetical protein